MNKPVSKCCKAPMKRGGSGEEGTFYYICTKCEKPCDIYNGDLEPAIDKEQKCQCTHHFSIWNKNWVCHLCKDKPECIDKNLYIKPELDTLPPKAQEEWEDRMRKPYHEWKDSDDELERTVYFIVQLSPHNIWKGANAIEELIAQSRKDTAREIFKEFEKIMHFEGTITLEQSRNAVKVSKEINELKAKYLNEE